MCLVGVCGSSPNPTGDDALCHVAEWGNTVPGPGSSARGTVPGRTPSSPLHAPPTSDRASQFPCTTSSTRGGISRKLYRNTSDGRRQARRDTTAGACGSVRRRGYSHQAGALSCFSWGFFTLPHQSLSWSASQSASRFVPPHQPNRQTCPLICPIPTARRFLAQLSWNAIGSPRPPRPSMLGISVLFCRRCVRGHST